MANAMTKPLDLRGQNERIIVSALIGAFIMNYRYGQMSRDFYCGITGDIQTNLSRHNVSGYTICIDCGSFDMASKIEEHLYHLGFDIGDPNNKAGNGGNENSTIVYMIEKVQGFKP